MTLSEKLNTLAGMYAAVEGLACYHYWRPRLDAPFLVWAEDSGDNLQAGNHAIAQALHGTTDYFTHTENDPMIDAVQEAQNGLDGLYWRLNSVQYEEETGLIHYEWDWRYIG